MAEADQGSRTYRGNCHCGAFIFEIEAPEITKASTCNCSICFKKGYNWVFPKAFTVVRGEGILREYTFGPKNTTHRFCPTCGSATMAYNPNFPENMRTAVNARCIQGLDTSKLERSTYNGSALDPQYEAPKFAGQEPTVDVEGGKVYHGSCHCGAVKLAIKVPVLDSTYSAWIKECNCSICQRNAYIWIYPKAEQVAFDGEENMAYYSMGSKVWRKGFCGKCGVQLVNRWTPLTEEEFAALPEEYRQRRGPFELTIVNLRTLNDFDLKALKPEQIEMSDGQNKWGPAYVNP